MSVGTDGNLFATVVSMENRVSTALKGPVVAIRGGASSMSPSAAGMHMNRRWGIVGGGFLGMTLAADVRDDGAIRFRLAYSSSTNAPSAENVASLRAVSTRNALS